MAKKQDGPPKVSYGIRVQQHIYAAVQAIANEKKWSESQTTDELLEWTIKQLSRAGSFDALLKKNIEGAREGKKGPRAVES